MKTSFTSFVSLLFTFRALRKYLPACPDEGTNPPSIILLITSGPNFALAIRSGKLTRGSAKNALYEIVKSGKELSQIIAELDLGNVSNEDELLKIVEQVISEEPQALEQAKSNPQTINFLVGKVMQKTKGKADPQLTLDLLKKKIS